MNDTAPSQPLHSFSGDILHGADDIAVFLYGSAKHRRKIYNLIAANRLPHFRLGNGLCARKSVLLAWINAQEQSALLGSPS